ncbi:MAG TPA: MraY family glycosyltransferase, partial [Opitutales bacterium]|nr:MraY family glycosyltransferase [Opitutales bacterium]
VLFFLLLGCFVSWLVIHLALRARLGVSGCEQIQHHHTHTGVIPRMGGLGIIVGFTATYLLCFFFLDEEDNQSLIHYSVFAGAVAAFILGFVDDIHPLGAKVKLLAQIIIALFAHHAGLEVKTVLIPFTDINLSLGVFGIFFTVAWVVALMNLINLIDGLDGLAGGIGLMLMCLLAYLAYRAGSAFSLILSLGMCGAILGFLFHNFPPAKVYMGDSGAYLIGYVIAAISLLNSEKGTVLAALIAPVLALALPICDVAFAILRRGLKGLPLFRPDRGHIHHRLVASGLSRQNTVLILYAVSLLALIAALLAFSAQGRYLPIFLGAIFVLILLALRGQKLSAQSVGKALSESFEARPDTKNALQLRDWFSLEANRADTGEHLWSDYRFVLKKIGFCRAELRIATAERAFYLPNTPHDEPEKLWQENHRIGAEMELRLYAEKTHFSEKQFYLVSDIACEAWTRAAAQWRLSNDVELTFDAKAREPANYRAQKSRSLYRPTY